MLKLLLLAISLVITLSVQANDSNCSTSTKTYKNIDVSIIQSNNCVSLKCNNVIAENVHKALAQCIATQKDTLFCNWQKNRIPITEVNINLVKDKNHNVTISKCNT